MSPSRFCRRGKTLRRAPAQREPQARKPEDDEGLEGIENPEVARSDRAVNLRRYPIDHVTTACEEDHRGHEAAREPQSAWEPCGDGEQDEQPRHALSYPLAGPILDRGTGQHRQPSRQGDRRYHEHHQR